MLMDERNAQQTQIEIDTCFFIISSHKGETQTKLKGAIINRFSGHKNRSCFIDGNKLECAAMLLC